MKKKETGKNRLIRWQCFLLAFLLCVGLIGPAAPAFAETEASGEGLVGTASETTPISEEGESFSTSETETSETIVPESTLQTDSVATTEGEPVTETESTEVASSNAEETTEVTPENVEQIIEEAVEGGEIAAPEEVLVGFALYASVQRGTTTATVNYRYQPGTNNPSIGTIPKGTVLTILGDGKDKDGDVWFLVTYNGKQGYVSSPYITLSTMEVGGDAAFEAELSAQGFPESYKQKLRILHAQYPNWKFVAQKAGNWSTALTKESWFNPNGPGGASSGGTQAVSLVDKNSIASWKSTEPGAFDWNTGKWITGWDGDAWAVASKELVAYYLDPRNFLDDASVFQFLDLADTSADAAKVASVASGMGARWLTGSYTHANGDTINYPEALLNAAKKAGFNPMALCSILIQELGVNGADKPTISGTVSEPGHDYRGYYNYFNIGAYTDSEHSKAYLRGLHIAAGWKNNSTSWGRPWNSRTKALDGGAEYFAEYITRYGQDTLYLKRFDVLSGRYSHQYSTDIQGADGEGRILSKAYSADLRKGTLTFKIPVYSGMPASAAPMPSDNINPAEPVRNFIVRLYQTILGRDPDSKGLSDWYYVLTTGKATAVEVASSFVFSQEYLNRNVSDTTYLQMLYRAVLGREPEVDGMVAWQAVLNRGASREGVFAGFANSQEFTNICNKYGVKKGTYTSSSVLDKNMDVTAFVTRMYSVCLGRSAREDERAFWVERLLNHIISGSELAGGFFLSEELINKRLSNQNYVTILYRTLFDREPDTAGLNAWVNVLNRGESRSTVLKGFTNSVEFDRLCKRFGITR